MEARGVQVRDDRLDLFARELRVEQWGERHDRVFGTPLVANNIQRTEAPLLRIPQLGQHRLLEARRCLAMRGGVRPDDGGDLGQRVRRPQEDRREQWAGHDEGHGLRDPRVVIPGVPVAGGEVHKSVVGGVRRPILRVTVGEVVPDIRRHGPWRDFELA